MRKLNLISGALGVTALALTACSNDELKVLDQKVDADQTQYLAVAISTPPSNLTRADFDNGTTDESAVKSLLFVFYDGAGNPTAQMKTLTGTQASQGWTENENGNDVTRFWTSVVPVEMTQGQNKPVYVMCFINPIDQTNLAIANLTEVDAMKRTSVGSSATGFAMSNAVYYGDNPITGQTNVRMMATPILEGQLFATEDEAKAAVSKTGDEGVLDIYVERYAAKIGLTMAADAIKPYAVKKYNAGGDLTDATLIYTPTAWRPNAIDQQTYVTKAFATGTNEVDPTAAPAFADLEKAFANTGLAGQGINGWNDPTNHRSYWACSPSYYAALYPKCSDDITDTGAPTYALKYFTWNEMNTDGIKWNNGFTLSNTGANASGYFYSRETTASIENIQGVDAEGAKIANYNNKAVVASAVIIGQYGLLEGSATTPATPADFWLFGKSEGKDVLYDNINDIEAALIANQNVIFADAEGTTPVTDPAIFTVMHPSQEVREGYDDAVAGRLVTIQMTSAPTQAVYFNLDGEFVPVTGGENGNLVEANRLLWKSASTAQYFNAGRAFFSIPIRHLGWGNDVPDNAPLLAEGGATGRPSTINWGNLRRGDLGVVRNHVYTIEVTAVNGLGVGLASPTQPIVPPMDPDNFYLAAKLNVLSWRVVPTQSVTL